jgi:hypothetical protein
VTAAFERRFRPGDSAAREFTSTTLCAGTGLLMAGATKKENTAFIDRFALVAGAVWSTVPDI